MNRKASYSDAKANLYVASQIRAQGLRESPAMNHFSGHTDTLYPTGPENNNYILSRRDRDAPKVLSPSQMLPQLYADARQEINYISRNDGLVLDSATDFPKQATSHEQDMEIGYEDKPQPLTFEGMEKKFQDEIFNLVKEQADEEDAEIGRHKEKMMELNTNYYKKLSALRALQASRMEDFVCKESEERLQQYHQAGTHSNNLHAYATEKYQAYTNTSPGPFEQSPPFIVRNQGTESRVSFPQGRVYNNAGTRY